MSKPATELGPSGEPVSLIKWFKHDLWERQQGAKILVGLDPGGTVFRKGKNEYGHPVVFLDYAVFLDGRTFACKECPDSACSEPS